VNSIVATPKNLNKILSLIDSLTQWSATDQQTQLLRDIKNSLVVHSGRRMDKMDKKVAQLEQHVKVVYQAVIEQLKQQKEQQEQEQGEEPDALNMLEHNQFVHSLIQAIPTEALQSALTLFE